MTDLMDLLEMELTDEATKKEMRDPANPKKPPEALLERITLFSYLTVILCFRKDLRRKRS